MLCEISFKEIHVLISLTLVPQLVKPFVLVNLGLSLTCISWTTKLQCLIPRMDSQRNSERLWPDHMLHWRGLFETRSWRFSFQRWAAYGDRIPLPILQAIALQPKVARLLWHHEARLPNLVVQLLDQCTRFGIYLTKNI